MTRTVGTTDLWLVPGSASLALFMPDLYVRCERGEITETELYLLIERRLLAIVIGAMHDLGVRNISLIEDLVQELRLRLATMNAVERFDPAQSLPTTYLAGVARMLIREQLWRRQRPEPIDGDTLDQMGQEGTQLDRAVRDELLAELKHWLAQLSAGEIRAIVQAYGPIFEHPAPIGPRRQPPNPDALPRAIDILKQLCAQTRQ